jgi:succinate dehydrogenase / fumarate reductase iron-sulfur subunit
MGSADGRPTAKTVTFRVRRFEPGTDREPRWEDHRVEIAPGMTVLDGLWKVKELAAPSLAWRSSCRMGICGSCGMLVNGRPRLACNTQVGELRSDVVTVAPLPNFDIVKDLVPDLDRCSTPIVGCCRTCAPGRGRAGGPDPGVPADAA